MWLLIITRFLHEISHRWVIWICLSRFEIYLVTILFDHQSHPQKSTNLRVTCIYVFEYEEDNLMSICYIKYVTLECFKMYGDMEIVTKTHGIVIKAMGIVIKK